MVDASQEQDPVTPQVLSSEVVFQGRLFEVRVEEVCLPNGRCGRREMVLHPGAVVVVAMDQEGRVVVVTQYRHAVGQRLLELPAGTLEPGEDPAVTARRELREEAGLEAAEWTALGSFYSSPGFLREELHAFLARGLSSCGQELEDDEDIELEWLPLASLLTGEGDLKDAKTLAALCLVERQLRSEERTQGDEA